MALTDTQKARVKYFLGYAAITEYSTIIVGQAFDVSYQYKISYVLEQIPAETEPMVVSLIDKLEKLEVLVMEAAENQLARSVDELVVNTNAHDGVVKAYMFWAKRLADLLNLPLNLNSYLNVEGPQRSGSIPRSVS